MGGELFNSFLISDLVTSVVTDLSTEIQKILVANKGGTDNPARVQQTPSQTPQTNYQTQPIKIVDSARKDSQSVINVNQSLQKTAGLIAGSFSLIKPWAPQGETCHSQAYYDKQKAIDEKNVDPQLVEKAMGMAEKADNWGVGLKVDNPFHYLMALEPDRFSEGEIRGAYRTVTEVRNRLFKRIQEGENYLGRSLTVQEKLALVYEIIEKEMGFQYAHTYDLMDGLRNGKLDCDTTSYIVLAVAHEMGWPVKGVMAPEHFFIRWDDGQGTRFNMDLGGKSYSDEDYQGKFYREDQRISQASITNGTYLKSLSREELIGNFLALEGNNIEDLNEAIRLNPSNFFAWSHRGSFYLNLGETKKGLDDLAQAAALDPNDIGIPLYEGLGNYKFGRFEDAQSNFQEAYQALRARYGIEGVNPGENLSPEDWMEKLAKLLLVLDFKEASAGHGSNAQDCCNSARDLLSHLPKPTQEKIIKEFNEHPNEFAEGVYSEILSQNPKNPFALEGLGKVYYFEKKYDQARGLLEQVISENPFNASAQFTLGNIYTNLKEYEPAKNAYQAALWVEPNNPDYQTKLGWALYGIRDFSGAQKAFLDILFVDPQNKEAILGIAYTQLFLGDPQTAKSTCEKLLSMDPKNPEALKLLAWAYHDLKEDPQALKIFESLYSQDPKSNMVLLGLGSVYCKLKNYNKAKSFYYEALEKDPENRDARVGLGIVYLEEGKTDFAQTTFQNILFKNYQKRSQETFDAYSYTYEDAGALYGLGKVYSKKGDYKQALHYLETAVQLWPYDRRMKEDLQRVKAKIHFSH